MDTRMRSLESRLKNLKEGLGVLRELAVIIIVGFLFLWPAFITRRLEAAGFEISSIGGIEVKRVQRSSEETGEARQRTEAVEQRVDSIRQELTRLASRVTNAQVRQEIQNLSAQLDTSVTTVRSIGRDLTASLQAQESFLRQAQPADADDDGRWGIVVGGTRTYAGALDELRRARGAGYSLVSIYQRQNWFRTVIEFPSSADAQAALQTVRARVRSTAYVVDLQNWCPNRGEGGQENLYRCPS